MEAEHPKATAEDCFIPVDKSSHFSIFNIPFGVFSTHTNPNKRCGSAIGEHVIDLSLLEKEGHFNGPHMKEAHQHGHTYFDKPTLNDFMGLTRAHWVEVRQTIQNLLRKSSPLNNEKHHNIFPKQSECTMHLPAHIGDYTDFYSSKNHAYNLGCILRGPANALQSNWVHLPVGYHGRSSSIQVTPADVRRPRGQTAPPGTETPNFTECKRMDFELEVGAFLGGKLNKQGHPIKVKDAEQNIFGLVLLNDWSARDLQGWEYVPLGPFTAKNLSTLISPWIVTLDALEPFKVALPKQDPVPLEYLRDPIPSAFDIKLEVLLSTEKEPKPERICLSNMKYLYWSVSQQLAHHTVSGCNMNPGDLLGSGTISGTEKHEFGSMMELSWGAKSPMKLANGEERTFLNDGDTVIMTGHCERPDGTIVGFGECRGKVLPCLPLTEYY